MTKKFKLGVIGAGFMSTAIIGGAISSGFLSASDIAVTDKNEEAKNRIAKRGVFVTDAKTVFNESEFVLFAVKPQNFAELKADAENKTAGCVFESRLPCQAKNAAVCGVFCLPRKFRARTFIQGSLKKFCVAKVFKG